VLKAENLTAICDTIVLENVGASTSHNTIGFHGLLQGQLYLYFLFMYRLYMYSASNH
jgi:hypothetical protein